MQRMSRRQGSTQAVAVEEEPTVLDAYSHLLVETGADPWVTCYNGQFLYCRSSDDRQIAVGKADHLADIAKDVQVVWEATEDGHLSREVWAPELHRIAHKWYIYFTAGLFDQHRMYVLESVTDDPQGEYTLKGKISDATDGWAIDGTVVGVEGTNYFVWSGWGPRGHGQQNLYIAEMSSPWEIIGPKVCIAAPEHAWEHSAIVARPTGSSSDWVFNPSHDTNEGPTALWNGTQLFIIYSAGHTATGNYCLGQLRHTGGDPLDAASWVKLSQPVFSTNDVFDSPGHSSFTKVGQTDWIVYHASKYKGSGWERHVLAAVCLERRRFPELRQSSSSKGQGERRSAACRRVRLGSGDGADRPCRRRNHLGGCAVDVGGSPGLRRLDGDAGDPSRQF